MTDFLLVLFANFLVVANITYIWFKTDFAAHLYSTIFSKEADLVLTREDFDWACIKKLDINIPFTQFNLGELLCCVGCFATWIATITGIIFFFAFSMPLIYIFTAMFGLPFLAAQVVEHEEES